MISSAVGWNNATTSFIRLYKTLTRLYEIKPDIFDEKPRPIYITPVEDGTLDDGTIKNIQLADPISMTPYDWIKQEATHWTLKNDVVFPNGETHFVSQVYYDLSPIIKGAKPNTFVMKKYIVGSLIGLSKQEENLLSQNKRWILKEYKKALNIIKKYREVVAAAQNISLTVNDITVYPAQKINLKTAHDMLLWYRRVRNYCDDLLSSKSV